MSIQLHVLYIKYQPVITTINGIGSSQDRGASIEGGFHPRLGNGDGLLLHSLVNGNLEDRKPR